MSDDRTEQSGSPLPAYDPDAYREERARIGLHQSQAIESRNLVYRALAAAGIGHEQADAIVSQVQAGAVAGAHTCISESTAPHGADARFEDGWHEGVRDVARQLLHIADTTATANRGIAASHGRYALIGQPETLVILERMETVPFLLRGTWESEEEDVFLDDLEFAWGPRIRLSCR
ncbi:hypothetical protein [Streptomyces anulatus]|uniref:hypothetical protein n=1 Tax=Streptomyces anulatus TaxID=1892 RepID=UPI0034076F99